MKQQKKKKKKKKKGGGGGGAGGGKPWRGNVIMRRAPQKRGLSTDGPSLKIFKLLWK